MENFTTQNLSIRKGFDPSYPYRHEENAWHNNKLIYGVDEAGRGCLAGPVVVGAVALKNGSTHPLLKDSKTLTHKQLLVAYSWLLEESFFTIGIADHYMIDRYNIYATTQKLMIKTLHHLHAQNRNQTPVAEILVDAMPLQANKLPANIPCISYIKGESESVSIAAASIIAKVSRDSILNRMQKSFPLFNLEKHKGYGTAAHAQILQARGASIIHRTSYLSNFIKTDEHKNEQQSLFF